MKILVIMNRPGLGGIETLMKRVVSFFHLRDGIQISILFISKGNQNTFVDFFKSKGDVYYGFDIVKNFYELKRKNFDYIYAVGLFSLLFSLFARDLLFQRSKICFGVYYTLEYCWKHGPDSYIRKLSYKLLQSFPLENILFMNQITKDYHSSYIGRDFSKSPIIPIAVDTNRFKKVNRKPDRKKIISVGRIVDFKTYVFQMVDVCCDLNRKNKEINVEYHIYGDGELKEKLIDYIKMKSASEFIFLHGTVPYDKLEDIFTDAFVFIGVGTSLIEASAASVPSLVGICSLQEPYTYGFFNEMRGYNLGEEELSTQKYSLYTKLLDLYNSSDEDYKKTSLLCQKKAELFSMEKNMNEFIDNLSASKDTGFKLSYFNYLGIIFSFVFWKILEKIGIISNFSARYCPVYLKEK